MMKITNNIVKQKFLSIPTLIMLLLVVISSTVLGQQRLDTFPSSYMPEAWEGFRSPVDYKPTTCDACGNRWLERWAYPCGTVYHPAWDLNAEKGLDDGKPVYAIGMGRIVWIGRANVDWMGVVVEHLYKGMIFYSAYGHVKNIKPDLVIGQVVKRGQQLAEVGNVGTKDPHLHFELRSSNHPNPTYGNFFCDYAQRNGRNASIRDEQTTAYWYLDPRDFVNNPSGLSTYVPSKPFVSIRINPSEVRNQSGRYYFNIELEEVHAMDTRLTNLWINGADYSGSIISWFGSAFLPSRSRRNAAMVFTGNLTSDQLLRFVIAGFDANYRASFYSDALGNFKVR